MLSNQALQLLVAVFGEQSNTSFPAGVARQVIEIADYAKQQLAPKPPLKLVPKQENSE